MIYQPVRPPSIQSNSMGLAYVGFGLEKHKIFFGVDEPHQVL